MISYLMILGDTLTFVAAHAGLPHGDTIRQRVGIMLGSELDRNAWSYDHIWV